ncbi:hypothetical protein N0V93_003950 [Gnomoniopsis smithogilvyi]|uniref:Major facilitator superfamily (MFS) profile domain-containing protein n=1 Tax=Gnomoniopsis smithogilvyi TaxID=1191159 RepID=A0A9W8YZG8_9PEZI|nr:hypothetical protein N0V93_003950 [Gnomoniopsis smithogilvyi]
MAVGIASAAIYSILTPIADATDLTLDELNTGTGYMFLAFGWGCLVFQPIAQQYGKRPTYLFSLLATMGIMIWAPFTTTNGQWIANKVLQGLVGAPIESLCEISVSDIYFTHERGTYMGVYALFLTSSNFVAPLIAGFINDGQGWQWVLYWCAIFCGIGFVICFLFMEETNYHRPTQIQGETVEAETAVEVSKTSDPEKTPTAESMSPAPSTREGVMGQSQKSFVQKMALFHRGDLRKKNMMKGMVLRPLIFLTFPVIFAAGFMYGSILCYFNILNGTTSLILSSAPYNFSSSKVGLTYIATLLGSATGSYYSGPLGDKFVLWKARRNGGIREPEHRLWLYVMPLLIVPSGLLLWGVGAAHNVHWFGLVVAMYMLGTCIAVGCQIPVAYCIDSYSDFGADGVVTVIIVRNTMSFAIGYGITPWVTNMGYQNAFLVAAFAALVVIAGFLVFIKFGKGFRKNSTQRYLKYIKQREEDGLAH